MALAYIIFTIILIHIIAGLAWAIYKISKKPTGKPGNK